MRSDISNLFAEDIIFPTIYLCDKCYMLVMREIEYVKDL